MYHIEFGREGKPPLKYTYLVGVHFVGIITPSRKWYRFPISEVSGRPSGSRIGENDGTVDSRLSPKEVTQFVLAHNLK
jgi:hypothetical protein